MSVQQQSKSTTLQLVQLSLDQFSEIISKCVSAELNKVLPHIKSTVESSLNEKKHYTRSETAKKLGVSKTTLHNWMVSGKLVPLKPGAGRKCLYTAEQLEAFLKQGQLDVFHSNLPS